MRAIDKYFKTPLQKKIFMSCMCVACALAVYFCLNINTFLRLFYRPEASMIENLISFAILMASCFAFGYILSHVMMWLNTGHFN